MAFIRSSRRMWLMPLVILGLLVVLAYNQAAVAQAEANDNDIEMLADASETRQLLGKTRRPTLRPSRSPSRPTTRFPTSQAPSKRPTRHPTVTQMPSKRPTTSKPSKNPTRHPTVHQASQRPSKRPTIHPTVRPTSQAPSKRPTTQKPSRRPTEHPTRRPTRRPTARPTTHTPTHYPSWYCPEARCGIECMPYTGQCCDESRSIACSIGSCLVVSQTAYLCCAHGVCNGKCCPCPPDQQACGSQCIPKTMTCCENNAPCGANSVCIQTLDQGSSSKVCQDCGNRGVCGNSCCACNGQQGMPVCSGVTPQCCHVTNTTNPPLPYTCAALLNNCCPDGSSCPPDKLCSMCDGQTCCLDPA